MERILPIGTVVEARGFQLILLGAVLMERDGKMVLAYHAVKYPRGFAGEESLGQLAASEITKILAEGYEDEIARRYNVGLAGLFGSVSGMTPGEAQAALDRAYEEWHAEMERLAQKGSPSAGLSAEEGKGV